MSNFETFKLSRPLKTHNGDVTELTLIEPEGGVYLQYGDPYTVQKQYDADGKMIDVIIQYSKDNNRAMMGFLVNMVQPRMDDVVLSRICASDYRRLREAATNILFLGVQSLDPPKPSDAQ